MERQKQIELQEQQATIGGITGGLIFILVVIGVGVALQIKKKKAEEQRKKDEEMKLSVNPIRLNTIVKNNTLPKSPLQATLTPSQHNHLSFGESIQTIQPTQLRKSIEEPAGKSKYSFLPVQQKILSTSPIKVTRLNEQNMNTSISKNESVKNTNINTNTSSTVTNPIQIQKVERQFFPAQMIRPSDRIPNKNTSGVTVNKTTEGTSYINSLNMYQSNQRRMSVARQPIKTSNIQQKVKQSLESLDE
jgi:hypothetical protein